ncbi:MurR/RpiR family transcriptional regulator [Lentilitoribacter sp. Alg239-R112]|jgi:DNA-binding MurR/RpiR family transcriptional regulator|uniref:MurR/RpiR family transcriptional regulator n=1 Tax=Lentilitoribacter sp. Alg239-R112 TaxID=2305987 RepID=UPI0013A694CA|nr:MurR/RpiR family transcriptional regulator [Lentilitoribacter sp. Alg239-R112]
MPKVIDIISNMRSLLGSLPKREQLVAEFVLTNLDQISFLSQNEIAKAANVSVATVNRFCTSIGCEGFRDFQIRMAQSVAVGMQYLDNRSGDMSISGQLVSQVFGNLIDTLKLTGSQLDGQQIEEAAEVLANAHRIGFLGVGGGSANVAREGANRFFRLGIPAESHSDGFLQRMVASTYSDGDVLVAISSSGQPAELLDSVTIARQYGASTISLTKKGSELSAITDISIQVDIPEDQDIYAPTSSRLAYLAIVDVLAAGAARKRPEQVKENLRRIRTSLAPLYKDTGPKPIGD